MNMFKYSLDDSVEVHVQPTTSAADTLRELMEMHQITQVEFARHIDISQKQLSKLLNRKAYMSIDVAERIEAATGVSARWLLQLDFNYQYERHAPVNDPQIERFPWAMA
jgi:plasmid maintenance system antidote protein VapI